jgi:hypothetical protein
MAASVSRISCFLAGPEPFKHSCRILNLPVTKPLPASSDSLQNIPIFGFLLIHQPL